jgi:DNA/RNA-binding protein KIN17
MNDSGDVIKIDQVDLETVIPQASGHVKIVNGAYRGEQALLVSVNTDRFTANVKLESGSHLGTIIEVPYEDISKISSVSD